MTFKGFSQSDFDIFTIPGLDARMEVLKEQLRPKLESIGKELAPFLSAHIGEEFFPHVAKHARRTVNPPNDTWVALANNKRGYKKHPHFQVGLWSSHLFIWFALIYESPMKVPFALHLLQQLDEIYAMLPPTFKWSWDHMKPESTSHQEQSKEELQLELERVIRVKKAEVLCGITIDKHDPILRDGEALLNKIEDTYSKLIPLYRLSR